MAEALTCCSATGDGENPEDWELVERGEAWTQQKEARDLFHKTCEEDKHQAAEALRGLYKASAELDRLLTDENGIDDVHRACCVPGTAVPISAIMPRMHLLICTTKEHGFQDGQNVIITGLSLNDGAPQSAACTVNELSRDHASCLTSMTLVAGESCSAFAKRPRDAKLRWFVMWMSLRCRSQALQSAPVKRMKSGSSLT